MRWIAIAASVLVVALLALAAGSAWADHQIVVSRDSVEPGVFHTATGERVEFVNRSGRAVHIEFTCDATEHELVQLPVTGPASVVFHRPGRHAYVVHVYERAERTLTGVVEVADDPEYPSALPGCDGGSAGACIEP